MDRLKDVLPKTMVVKTGSTETYKKHFYYFVHTND
jgi:hypothetical protein